MTEPDVVVVGAGIAGGAMAATLARSGLDVVVLERTLEHEDRVRGEFMQPWGVAEAQRIGVYDDLMAAGGNVIRRLIQYSDLTTPEEAEAAAVELAMLPGVEGPLGIAHPVACNALDAAAVAAGADLIRGVTDVRVSPGAPPSVTYNDGSGERTLSPRMVIAADGRESGTRKSLGFELHATDPVIMGAGLLVTDVQGWPREDCVIGPAGEWLYLVFPQGPDTARLYLMYEIANKHKLVGSEKAKAFLDAFRAGVEHFPKGALFADATPAGPCGAFPMNDTWLDVPVTDGVVLIGDAAGWSDPLIGQGLSVAMRDVRLVSEVLLAGDDWPRDAFAGYVEERADRMRRLRFSARVIAKTSCDAGPGGLERRRAINDRVRSDPQLFFLLAITLVGPEMAPADIFTDEALALLFQN